MKHRTHDHLFAAAGVTAALSLIGTGATVLKGSVFHFDHWPLVAGDSARNLQLPTAPIAPQPEAQSARQALLSGATRVGGTAALLPGLGGPSGVSSISLTVPAAASTATGEGGTGAVGTGKDVTTTGTALAAVTRDGSGFSLGSAPSGSVDGTREPASSPGVAGNTRVAPSGSVDTDGDGIPDTWEKDHGAPVTPDAPSSTSGSSDGRDPTTASAFTADPPATPAPDPATTPVEPPPATDPSTDPGQTDPPADPAPTGDPTPTDPAPTTDPVPADPAPEPDPTPPADPAPSTDPVPADPAPSTDPAPADPTPPADPAPAPAPAAAADPAPPADPAPAPAAAAPADSAPAADPAPAPAAANAAIPAGVQ
jgi:hypothetical protein